MSVLAVTIFVGFLLVGFFVVLWIATACDSRHFNERDRLLPLESDTESPSLPPKKKP